MPLYPAAQSGPITLSAINVATKTSGSPADVAVIAIPAGIARFRVIGTNALLEPALNLVPNTFGSTQGAASFTLYDGAGGTGQNVSGAVAGPTASGGGSAVIGAAVSNNNYYSSSRNIYVRQTVDSANAGTNDFYVRILPL